MKLEPVLRFVRFLNFGANYLANRSFLEEMPKSKKVLSRSPLSESVICPSSARVGNEIY